MAGKDNRIATKESKITLAWPLYAYLDRAIATGRYGTSFTSAIETAIEKHIGWLIETQRIKELTPQELSAQPNPDYVKAKKR